MADRSAAPLVCRDLVELVTERLDGALSAPEAAAFDAHIADCDGCAAYVAQFRTTIRAVRAVSDELEATERARLVGAWRRATGVRD
jgi:anti-sigma factor RsiW